eukprot:7945165-Ditylum_brightwellii.AAC.1
MVPHAAAKNLYKPTHRWNTSPPTPAIVPYASAHISHASQQKVSKNPNTASTSEYVPMHSISFLPDSTGDNSNKDAFCTITTSYPRIFTYVMVAITYMPHV